MSGQRGPLVILSGPSGAGKSTVVKRLLDGGEWPLRLSVSATTRPPRGKERDGVEYHFWTRERFLAEVAAGAFLEWADVFGNCYGTLRSEVDPYRERGVGVILDIDVQGAVQVRQKCPDAVTVFLRTSSMDEYERRLRKRHTEDAPALQRRLAAARGELAHAGEYQHQVINDDLESAVADLRAIIGGLFPKT
jgi:guanylate kinase